jgi:hypothetical protein
MHIIIRATIEKLLRSYDLTHFDFARKTISSAEGNADVAVGDDAKNLALASHDRKKSTIPIPHQLRGRTQVCLGLAAIRRSCH